MSLGGKQTQTQSIDPALRQAALENLAMAKRIGQLGFVPYTEATVAGMSPAQIAAIQNTNAGAAAFGLTPSAVPTGGDLSPNQIYRTALNNMAPGQRAFIEAMFINPMTGAAPAAAMAQEALPVAVQAAMAGGGGGGGAGGGGGGGNFSASQFGSRLPGGVNTANPNSVLNRVAAAMSPRQSAPTAGSRPKANPKR